MGYKKKASRNHLQFKSKVSRQCKFLASRMMNGKSFMLQISCFCFQAKRQGYDRYRVHRKRKDTGFRASTHYVLFGTRDENTISV